MGRLFLAASFFICFLQAAGQTTEKQRRDSLSIGKDDKSKVNLLIKLSRKVSVRYHDSAMQLAMNAMVIAKRSENEKDIARVYRAIGKLFYNQGQYTSAIENFKIAFIHSENVKDPFLLSAELD